MSIAQQKLAESGLIVSNVRQQYAIWLNWLQATVASTSAAAFCVGSNQSLFFKNLNFYFTHAELNTEVIMYINK